MPMLQLSQKAGGIITGAVSKYRRRSLTVDCTTVTLGIKSLLFKIIQLAYKHGQLRSFEIITPNNLILSVVRITR